MGNLGAQKAKRNDTPISAKKDRKTNIELVETMWEQFSGLGIYESNVIDTTTFTIKDTVSAIKERVACGTSLLS